jgi:hypothetical protein
MSRRISIFGASFASVYPWQAETIAYMTAVGIPADGSASIYGVTNLAVWQAWDAFFVTLKGAGLLSKHYYIRGMTGALANAANYKFNAINPLDTDAAYRAVYFGGVTFTDKGTQGNGSNGYANSFFNDQTAGVATNDFGITMYSRTNSVRNETAMGVVADSTYMAMQPRFDTSPNGDRFWCYDNSSFSGNVLTRSDGAFTVTREPATANTQRAYRNGVQFNQRTSLAPTALSNLPIFELGLNYFNGSLLGPSNRQFSYFAAHRGMTAAETATYHTAIQTLQTGLNRQV